jgi:2-keto-4-pentenoate hydratase/2-oxohepta-3-ene-1,7-dioic acid hydratase in catechol pathway
MAAGGTSGHEDQTTHMVRLYRIDHGGSPQYAAEREGRWRLVDGDIFGEFREGPEISSDGLRLLPPVLPSKIVCVGLNYKDHAAEQHKPLPPEPLIFIKPSTAVIGPGAAIEAPDWAGRFDHEAELGIVIGKPAYRVRMNQAHQYILGLTAVNDVTARDLQNKDGQYTRSKGFDTFAPIGPCIAAGLEGRDLQVRGYVNGHLRQDSRTRELIFNIPELVEFISSVMTLLPGDIISTGTPSGIGPLRPGDSVTIHVEGIGALTNPVVAREE